MPRCLTKVVVTGSTGFVGGHLVERLLAAGGMQVVCLVRRATNLAWLKTLPVEIRSADDPAALAGAEIIFHVAGLTRGRTLEEYLKANAWETERLLEAVPAGLKRLVYVSSLAAVGPNPTAAPADETTVPQPHDAYGRSKLAGERIVLDAANRLSVVVVRPPGVYGPRDTNLLPVFRLARRWGMVPVMGGREKAFSLVHVEDLAEGIFLAGTCAEAALEREGRTFFVASGTYTMEDMAGGLSAALGGGERKMRLVHVPAAVGRLAGEFGQLKWALTGVPQIMARRKIRDLLQPRWTCSWAKARRVLGYEEKWTLEAGLKQTAEWYVREGWMG